MKNQEINLHTHTYLCHHGSGVPSEYAAIAVRDGLKVLGFSDHIPFPDDIFSDTRMRYIQRFDYYSAIDEAQQRFPELILLRGYEVEYVPEQVDYQHELLDSGEADYLIGSLHYYYRDGVKTGFSANPDAKELKQGVEQFADLLSFGRYLFVAHPDLFWMQGAAWNAETRAAARDILQLIRDAKLPAEINAYGARKPQKMDQGTGLLRAPYPVRQFWELAAETGGIEVIINSDAHTPNSVVGNCADIFNFAAELGLPVVNAKAAELLLPRRETRLRGADGGTRCAVSSHTGASR